MRFERKDTSRKGAKGAKFGKDLLTTDLHRLSQIYADQRSAHRAWRIAQSDKRRRTAGLSISHTAKRPYNEFLREGLGKQPWEKLRAQIFLGGDIFIEKHMVERESIQEVPRAQWKPVRPSLGKVLRDKGMTVIGVAYRDHGYRMKEIADHLGVHYATVSRRLKKIEVRGKNV